MWVRAKGFSKKATERTKTALEGVFDRWGAFLPLGDHIRVQAHDGYRAAVMQLRPGMWIVAEIPAEVKREEVGFVPLVAMLAPVIVKSAKKALAQSATTASAKKAAPQLPVLRSQQAPIKKQRTKLPISVPWFDPEDDDDDDDDSVCICEEG